MPAMKPLSEMRRHIGQHILQAMCKCAMPEECSLKAVGDEPCGFCGVDACITNLTSTVNGKYAVTSNCPYHFEGMKYQNAKTYTTSAPCTNVPIHCTLCELSSAGKPQTIWKYNAIYHMAIAHATSSGNQPHSISGQMLIDIHITKEEDKKLKIPIENTLVYREENQFQILTVS